MSLLLHDLLRRATDTHAGSQAVRCAGRSLTYAEVAGTAAALSRTLVASGITVGDRVGICMPKRVEMLPALYGILAAGAAYVPLDPKAPSKRSAFIAADCAIKALVATPTLARALLADMGDRAPQTVVVVTDDPSDLPAGGISFSEATSGDDPAADVHVRDDDLAYILYTSGSTGSPKGVMLSHANAMAFVEWSAGAIGSDPRDRFSNHAPLHFDLSVFDLYVAAWGAATVVLVPEEEAYLPSSLASLVRDEGVTVWYSVPSALIALARALSDPGALPSLRAVVFAGEVYPVKHLRGLRRLLPGPVLWNLYGPTETNVVTAYRVDAPPADDASIPIGRACSGAEVVVVADDGCIAEPGEEGELYVSGPTVMRGYWGQPERTAEVLVPSPADPSGGTLAYRTGDRVCQRPDGDLDFIGRRDHQVKSRGYRIELGEVETALASHPLVEEAVAVAVPHRTFGSAVVAFVTLTPEAELTTRDIKHHVAAQLPRYMVPTEIQIRVDLPRTSSGKIDRVRLADEHPSTRTEA